MCFCCTRPTFTGLMLFCPWVNHVVLVKPIPITGSSNSTILLTTFQFCPTLTITLGNKQNSLLDYTFSSKHPMLSVPLIITQFGRTVKLNTKE